MLKQGELAAGQSFEVPATATAPDADHRQARGAAHFGRHRRRAAGRPGGDARVANVSLLGRRPAARPGRGAGRRPPQPPRPAPRAAGPRADDRAAHGAGARAAPPRRRDAAPEHHQRQLIFSAATAARGQRGAIRQIDQEDVRDAFQIDPLLRCCSARWRSRPAAAQRRQATPEQRIERLEKQVRQVQGRIFPKGQPVDTAGFIDDPAATQASVTALITRLDAVERQMAEMTRSSEENGNRIAVMEADLARLRADQDRRLRALETGAAPAAGDAAAPATGEADADVAARAASPMVETPARRARRRPGADARRRRRSRL